MDKCQYRHLSYEAFVFRGICLLTGQTFDSSVRYEHTAHHPLKMSRLIAELKNLSNKNWIFPSIIYVIPVARWFLKTATTGRKSQEMPLRHFLLLGVNCIGVAFWVTTVACLWSKILHRKKNEFYIFVFQLCAGCPRRYSSSPVRWCFSFAVIFFNLECLYSGRQQMFEHQKTIGITKFISVWIVTFYFEVILNCL